MSIEKLHIQKEIEISERLWQFLVKHLGSRPDENVSIGEQDGPFVENPFPFGLGDNELIQLGGMIDLKDKEPDDRKIISDPVKL